MTDSNSALTAWPVPTANARQSPHTIQQPFRAEVSVSQLGDGDLIPRSELAGVCEMQIRAETDRPPVGPSLAFLIANLSPGAGWEMECLETGGP